MHMGWGRSHFHKERKQVRHAQVSLGAAYCVDCLVELPGTHLFHRFGDRCRRCFGGALAGAVSMACHYPSDEGLVDAW